MRMVSCLIVAGECIETAFWPPVQLAYHSDVTKKLINKLKEKHKADLGFPS